MLSLQDPFFIFYFFVGVGESATEWSEMKSPKDAGGLMEMSSLALPGICNHDHTAIKTK